MQGINKGFDVLIHDITWTCLYDMAEDEEGATNIARIYSILEDNQCKVKVW